MDQNAQCLMSSSYRNSSPGSVLSMDTGAPLVSAKLSARVRYVGWSPDNTLLVVGCDDKSARSAPLPPLSTACAFFFAFAHLLLQLAISPDIFTSAYHRASRSYSPTHDSRVFLATTLVERNNVGWPHREDVVVVGISPNNRYLATGSKDKWGRVFDLAVSDPSFRLVFSDRYDRVYALDWTSNGCARL